MIDEKKIEEIENQIRWGHFRGVPTVEDSLEYLINCVRYLQSRLNKLEKQNRTVNKGELSR